MGTRFNRWVTDIQNCTTSKRGEESQKCGMELLMVAERSAVGIIATPTVERPATLLMIGANQTCSPRLWVLTNPWVWLVVQVRRA